jgi:hypothetical protein
VDETRLLWLVNSGLLFIATLFIKKWLSDIEKKIDGKAEKETCDKTHAMLDKMAHTHATAGAAGEVVHYEK